MAACPYHVRQFNWWDPLWPDGMERSLNPDVSVRMRGIVEKCNFCYIATSGLRQDLRGGGSGPAGKGVSDGLHPGLSGGPITFGDLNNPRTPFTSWLSRTWPTRANRATPRLSPA